MKRLGRVTRFLNHQLSDVNWDINWDKVLLDDITWTTLGPRSNPVRVDSAFDEESVKLHRMLTDASSIAPPRGLAQRTIARIEQLRNPKAETRRMPKPESPKE